MFLHCQVLSIERVSPHYYNDICNWCSLIMTHNGSYRTLYLCIKLVEKNSSTSIHDIYTSCKLPQSHVIPIISRESQREGEGEELGCNMLTIPGGLSPCYIPGRVPGDLAITYICNGTHTHTHTMPQHHVGPWDLSIKVNMIFSLSQTNTHMSGHGSLLFIPS
jgi:hypothetical protein